MLTTETNKMSVIEFIDNTPLFTTLAEAKGWAKLNGLIGYHTHLIAPTVAKPLGQKGYMGGNGAPGLFDSHLVVSTLTTIHEIQGEIPDPCEGPIGLGGCICAYGCMDTTASNYDPNATCDDGSCL